MKRVWMLLTLLLGFSLSSFAPNETMWAEIEHEQYMKDARITELEKELELQRTIQGNLEELKTGRIKTRNEVYHLVLPILKEYLKEYQDSFELGDSLAYAVAGIFIIESGTKKGRAARSSLWIKYNNPFGLTAGSRYMPTIDMESWEHINGVRVVKIRTFRTFGSFKMAVDALMQDYLLKPRYQRLREAKTVDGFFHSMHSSGYTTNPLYGHTAGKIYQEFLNYEANLLEAKNRDAGLGEVFDLQAKRVTKINY